MNSHTLQTLRDPILLLPWLCFRGGRFPNPTLGLAGGRVPRDAHEIDAVQQALAQAQIVIALDLFVIACLLIGLLREREDGSNTTDGLVRYLIRLCAPPQRRVSVRQRGTEGAALGPTASSGELRPTSPPSYRVLDHTPSHTLKW